MHVMKSSMAYRTSPSDNWWRNSFGSAFESDLAPFPGLDWMIYLAEATGKNGHDGRWHQNSQFMSDGNRTSNPLHLTCVIP